MKIRCDYCGNYISDTDEVCGYCSAPNGHLIRAAAGVPHTIEELKAFCAAKKMPLEKMRFFLGQDYRGPKAFGIFKRDDGTVVVYKNKADGTRAVRYEGRDEAYAVNELYQKLKAEVADRKQTAPVSRSYPAGTARKKKPTKSRIIGWIILLIVILGMVSCTVKLLQETPNNGYYTYNGETYYNDNSHWYVYDNGINDWSSVYLSENDELYTDYDSYWNGYDYSSGFGGYDFDDSSYATSYYSYSSDSSYDSSSSYSSSWDDWNSDWDDDSDWGYDYSSWDSGSSDWDSDW